MLTTVTAFLWEESHSSASLAQCGMTQVRLQQLQTTPSKQDSENVNDSSTIILR